MTKIGAERFKSRYGDVFADLESNINKEFDSKRNEFKEYYSECHDVLKSAEDSFRNLIHLLLSDAPIPTPKVISRLKDRDESIKKFEIKYRNELEKSETEYSIKDYITDLIGIRVICLYEADIGVVKKVIEDHFDVLSITDKTQILTSNYNNFGYKGLHIDARLNSKRAKLPEYKRFAENRFEVQIRSIVQDAWSEVDHKLKYKRKIPDSLQRRIVRLAALFELADQEFISIRDETENLERQAVQEDLVTNSELEARPIDAFSFLAIMKSYFQYYVFSPETVDGFIEEIVSMKPDLTDLEFRDAMFEFIPRIQPYKDEKAALGFRLNPFTTTRYVLHWYDQKKFSDALYPAQKAAFKAWVAAEKQGASNAPKRD